MERILIDIGSSTVKVYKLDGKILTLLLAKSIAFKKDFKPKEGISKISKQELFQLIQKIKIQNPSSKIYIYATAIFRKFEKKTLLDFKNEFYLKTRIQFKVISQNLENKYLQESLIGKYKGKKKIVLVNIGGGSTELVFVKEGEISERDNIDLGVGNVLSKFPKINEDKSEVSLKKVISFVNTILPKMKNTAIAFYSGGELTYMQLVGYELEKNLLFKDTSHPSYISIENFIKKNKDIFNKLTLKDLEKLMPQNPTWMHGARACSGLAQAIFEKIGVKTIIPSDANLIDGVVKRDF
jgi:exopolyphosphatase/pppGpp-phosphohydrolase